MAANLRIRNIFETFDPTGNVIDAEDTSEESDSDDEFILPDESDWSSEAESSSSESGDEIPDVGSARKPSGHFIGRDGSKWAIKPPPNARTPERNICAVRLKSL